MSLTHHNLNTGHLRAMAHELSDNLQGNLCSGARRDETPLLARVSRVLNASQLSIHALDTQKNGTSHLRARAQRQGVGRSYVEEVDLSVNLDELRIQVSLWVKDRDKNYFAGTWSLREDLTTGRCSSGYWR